MTEKSGIDAFYLMNAVFHQGKQIIDFHTIYNAFI